MHKHPNKLINLILALVVLIIGPMAMASSSQDDKPNIVLL